MATKKVGVLIKEARTAAGLTQEKLALAVGDGLTARDISNCENGKSDLTNAQLKKIAVSCGVTQASLLNAPKNIKTAPAAKPASNARKSAAASAKKSTSSSNSSASSSKKATEAAKKATSASKKPTVPANANISIKVTASEQKLIEAYRTAKSDNKKVALRILKGELSETATNLLGVASGSSSDTAENLGDLIGNAIGNLFGSK